MEVEVEGEWVYIEGILCMGKGGEGEGEGDFRCRVGG